MKRKPSSLGRQELIAFQLLFFHPREKLLSRNQPGTEVHGPSPEALKDHLALRKIDGAQETGACQMKSPLPLDLCEAESWRTTRVSKGRDTFPPAVHDPG